MKSLFTLFVCSLMLSQVQAQLFVSRTLPATIQQFASVKNLPSYQPEMFQSNYFDEPVIKNEEDDKDNISLKISTLAFKKLGLRWKTITEQQTSTFSLQRSKDALKYENMQTMKGLVKDQETDFIDENLQEGINYYRIVETTQEGKIIQHSALAVAVEKGMALGAWLEQAGEKDRIVVKVETMSKLTVTVNTESGMPIVCDYLALENYIELTPASSLEKGIYFVKIRNLTGSKEYKLRVSDKLVYSWQTN